ncbi:hypothetical protein HPO96_23170 [Kribbella sandramycini]|uniref:Uncharacterized protein n=1 Tax=Kribbella sandramycini TaxID=60450 RepID=A0A7Y4L2H8_9ACTN|nr:hypothetical protein [Kribbella sandramycini]MBB6566183.1 hypothetical protein [Kribbella sandramycini]NOL43150.1 hypothetical protein [Kribbella sandramycini]
MNRLITTALAALVVATATACGPTGTVVDKDQRTRQKIVNGKPQYEPCWWIKIRDSAGETHTFCTSRAKWRKVGKGDIWSGE